MASASDQVIHPLTHVLARLSRTEQLHVMRTHPLFTGKCPNCGAVLPAAKFPPTHWDCQECGWVDDHRLAG